MRVLHVLESLARGGVETTFLHVLRAFQRHPAGAGMRHEVLAFRGGPLQAEYAAAADGLTISGATSDIDRALARRYDVVHVLFDRCALRVAPLIAASYDSAMVIAKNYDMAAMFRVNAGHALAWDDAVVAAADRVTFTTPELGAAYPAPPGRTTFLRKAADVARFLDIPRPDAGMAERILCIANLHPRKRLADLAPALRLIRARIPSAELHIAGGGTPEAMELVRTAARVEGVDRAVTLLGAQSDVAAALAAARVVVLPSASEGVPTALLEAMAGGRPVVAARSGHLGHIATDGVEGFLVPPDDPRAMADRVSQLLGDRLLAARMGTAGRRRAHGHDVRVVAADILSVLQSVAAAPRRAA